MYAIKIEGQIVAIINNFELKFDPKENAKIELLDDQGYMYRTDGIEEAMIEADEKEAEMETERLRQLIEEGYAEERALWDFLPEEN